MNKFQEKIDKLINKILNEEIENKSKSILQKLDESGEWVEIDMEEELHGDQKKLDVAKPKGKLTAADFEKLRSDKKEMEEFYFQEKEEELGDYEGDEEVEDEAEELSAQEPTYVGMGLEDNKPAKMFSTFGDMGNWYTEMDTEHSGDFDFDYDEEEFDEFEPMFQKYGNKARWFAPGEEGKKFFNMYRDKFGPMKIRIMKDMIEGEGETEEGNAFTGALAQAKEKGENEFEVDGETFKVRKESKEMKEKWEDEVDVKQTGEYADMSIEELNAAIKKLKAKNEKKKEAGDKVPQKDRTKMSQLYFAKRAKQGWKGKGKAAVKESIQLTEDELIDMIERIVKEQTEKKVKNNIEVKKPVGLTTTEKAQGKTAGENKSSLKATTKKIQEYMKDGSKEKFTTEPKHFPQGNGEMAEMKKKAYKASKAVEEYIDNFARAAGLENIDYDEIKPNDEWVKDNIEGSSRTGNNPEWANAVPTELGKKINKKREVNAYAQEKKKSYNRYTQPVDQAGEHEGEKSLDKMFAKLESTEDKKEIIIKEEMEKMKNLISYSRKTQ